MATIEQQQESAEQSANDEPINASELIEQLDQRQDAILSDLDDLNGRIEDLLNECLEANRVILDDESIESDDAEDREDGSEMEVVESPKAA